MNQGTEDEVKGKFNEVKGSVTGDTGEELKGKAQQAWGDVQNKVGNATDNTDTTDDTDYNSGS